MGNQKVLVMRTGAVGCEVGPGESEQERARYYDICMKSH